MENKQYENLSEEQKREPMNEKTLFGRVKLGARVPGGFEGFKAEKHRIINQEEEIEKIKRLQPEGMAYFADELHTAVCENLNLENPNQLEFYTTIGTKIDYGLGIDGFMELSIGDGKIIRITLDGTENAYKVEKGKLGGKKEADVIFLWPQETEEENQFEWNLAIKNAAQAIAENFKNKVDGDIKNLDDETLQDQEITREKSAEAAKKDLDILHKKQKAAIFLHSHRTKKSA